MSHKLKEVKELLRKHDYITVIQKTGDGCIVTYPHPKLTLHDKNQPRLIECFAIQRGTDPGLWVSTSYDDAGGKDRFIEVPEYAIRLYISCEVIACNTKVPIDPFLYMYLDEDNQEKNDIVDIIHEPLLASEKKLESFLHGFVLEARNDGFPSKYEEVAKTHGVYQGYTLIRNFYN